jgi:PAS domain S-box-containing protein
MVLSFMKSIRARLVLLVLISVVPALGIIVYAGLEGRQTAVRNAEKDALTALDSLALEHERAVEGTRTLLIALSETLEVKSLNVKTTSRLFKRLLGQNPIYANLSMTDPAGKVMASAMPIGAGYVGDRKVYQDCVSTKDFSVGDYATDADRKDPVLEFGYPILGSDGRVKGVIIAASDLAHYGRLFLKAKPPEGTVVSIIDRRGFRLFRYPDQEGLTGKEFDVGRMKKAIEGPEQGLIKPAGAVYQGIYRKFRLHENEPPYLYIVLKISEKEILKQAGRVLSTTLILMCIACCVAVLSAVLIGNMAIAARLRRLVFASRELGRGDMSVRTGLGRIGGELGELAGTFDEMAERLEQKEFGRQRAEEALRQSDEQYRRIFENATVGIFQTIQTVPGGRFISVNPAMALMYGYATPEEMKAAITNIAEQLYIDPSQRLEYMRQLNEYGVVTNFESASCRKDGSAIWVRLNTRAVRHADGTILYNEGMVEDITSRKQAEESLRESEKKYRALIETTDTGFVILTSGGIVLDANEEYIRLAGYEILEQIQGRNVIEWTAEHDIRKNAREVQRCFEEGSVRNLEVDYVDRQGLFTPIEVNATLIEASSGPIIVSLCRDITQRKEAERALKESEEKYRNIFENAVMGIVQTTADGRYLTLNPAHARMFGYDSPEEMLRSVGGTTHQLYVRPEERAEFIRLMDEQGYVEDVEGERYRRDGSTLWVSINARCVKDSEGKVLYYEGTVENITSRKKAEEEKGRLESQLRQSQKMEAVGTLAGGIAHDFNNILTVVSGYGTLLQMETDATSPLRVYADQVLLASQKAASLTQSLLAFSRQQPITLRPMNLNEVVGGTEKLLKRLLTEDIALQAFLSSEALTVMADATQIDQILFNLATNARDAMPNGGTLTIETNLVELDGDLPGLFPLVSTGKYALLSVSDTGMGMDESTIDHIFDPFFTTKEVGKGTGLGLSTVYGVVKQHNGRIMVSSQKAEGTTFHIYLPIMEGGVSQGGVAETAINGGTETILVAEDNENVRILVRDVLTKHGYTVVEAADGEDAVVRFGLHRGVDLLIIDSVMPKMNGREVYDRIGKMDPDIKVLFTSGYTRDVILDKGIEEGQLDFLAKPINPEHLLLKVREMLDR